MSIKNLGITALDHVHFAVRSLETARKLYEERLGFRPIWKSGKGISDQRSIVYQAGKSRIVATEPVKDTSDAARWLRLHPEGVMALGFTVENAKHALDTIEKRGGTPMNDVTGDASFASFEIATPLSEVQFRFVERGGKGFMPGFEEITTGSNGVIPWIEIDHVTSNTRTMKPIIDWYRDVMGMEQFWDVTFHTTHVEAGKKKESGSGLKSIVMWDPHSGIKFATNEALRPFFRASQVDRFVTDNKGAGIQHIALHVPSIIDAVDELNRKGFKFLPAPSTYYQGLGDRLKKAGWDIEKVKEPISELARRNIQVDGSSEGYMLQIFQDELRVVEGRPSDPDGAPAFYEVIQRAGDRGFGYGNFRALFEAIEQAQNLAGRKD